jgi:hypothetical protein
LFDNDLATQERALLTQEQALLAEKQDMFSRQQGLLIEKSDYLNELILILTRCYGADSNIIAIE